MLMQLNTQLQFSTDFLVCLNITTVLELLEYNLAQDLNFFFCQIAYVLIVTFVENYSSPPFVFDLYNNHL